MVLEKLSAHLLDVEDVNSAFLSALPDLPRTPLPSTIAFSVEVDPLISLGPLSRYFQSSRSHLRA